MSTPVSVSDRERFDAERAFREREITAQELAQKLKQAKRTIQGAASGGR